VREPGGVVPESPPVLGDVDSEHPVHAAGVEVVHRRLPVDDPGDRDRIGNLGMVVLRALDQEPLILMPLERGLSGHDGAGKRRMRGLGRPRADQPLPAMKPGVLCLRLHRILHPCARVTEHKTWHPPRNYLPAPDATAERPCSRQQAVE
jgi:hypothetical protein